ncbi:MAG TPA: short-chain dehydrogenase [Candidatus Kapabacteria bacterium]|nr:short-chain dehydrogenase [Candidatus Kapabacteria bacterium]
MQIQNSKVLIFGGWGLVGSAICHKLLEQSPKQLIITSLRLSEAEEACEALRKEYPNLPGDMFVAKSGNIFTRKQWKDLPWTDVINDSDKRKGIICDIFDELDDEILHNSALYSIINEAKPDIVIDCINTATSFAYLDIYNTTRKVKNEIIDGNLSIDSIEKMMTNMYIPQLIRHIQILNKALNDVKAKIYLKIGTTGTGGMGLNIPYTHSEERPSRVLLSKSAVAGAHSLLLFLMARTPGGPLVKEIKPAATIAWKRIAYDTVMRKGRPIPLVDMPPENSRQINDKFILNDFNGISDTNENFKSVFIDTGENGIFSKGEFSAIGSLGQMEIVTPEEIATYTVYELMGGNTGKDIVQGLDAFVLGPTYRGGFLYQNAMNKIESLEKENNVSSIAFEMLGPPRLSKLLFETHILRNICSSMKDALKYKPEELSAKAVNLINSNSKLRSEMLSIGLVILFPDGKSYLRGKDVKIPANLGKNEIDMNEETLNQWCEEGWIDLRASSFAKWQNYIKMIMEQTNSIVGDITSSRFTYTIDYWKNFDEINEGKLVGWVFEYEDAGWRFKR